MSLSAGGSLSDICTLRLDGLSWLHDVTDSPEILVTGGAGYIGSHTLVELVTAGYRPVVLDNFSNAVIDSVRRVEAICAARVPVFEGDIGSVADLERVFAATTPAAVLHFAGLKAVGESAEEPIRYYAVNVGGTITLLAAMRRFGCRRLVFSSSATVYGDAGLRPVTETEPLRPANPYGHCKAMIEQIIADEGAADPGFRSVSLRYFNPVGAHESGLIGEDPRQRPNNLMPFVAQVAVGRREKLQIFGADYPTTDGTGIRDYIHVTDLARGHVAALAAMERLEGVRAINLGTGRGYSVMEMLRAFEIASGREIPYEIVGRRSGDVAAYIADTQLATQLLNWRAELGADRMCADTWRWQSTNPNGYISTDNTPA